MSKVALPHLDCFVDRHGRVRCYYRRGKGKRTPLPGKPGTPEFMRAYQDARDASANEQPAVRHRGAAGTFDRLTEEYFRSSSYLSNSQVTQSDYRRFICALLREENIGHRLVAQMTRQHVDQIVAKRLQQPGKATRLLSMLRILLDFAISLGWRSDNPAKGVKRPKLGTHHTWTEAEIARFEARWDIGTEVRSAFDLLLHTGQRSGDVRHMAWSAIVGDQIWVTQRKTTRRVKVPIHPDLALSLNQTPKNGLLILATKRGRPFSQSAFNRYLARAIELAGLPKRCVPHGLRKAAARRLAEAGCSSKEIQAITGHASLSEVERYTAEAEQDGLALSAMQRLTGHMKNRKSQTG